MKSNIQTITDFLSTQMDGEPVPPTNSPQMQELSAAIQSIQKHDSNQELLTLALKTIGLVIDRARSNIAAETTLHRFIRGEEL